MSEQLYICDHAGECSNSYCVHIKRHKWIGNGKYCEGPVCEHAKMKGDEQAALSVCIPVTEPDAGEEP
jgi:hypothetical protein